MNNKVVLVTGGAGYIGSHVCKALAMSGFTPVTYDNLCSGNLNAVKWGPFEKGDIRNPHRLAEVITKYRPMAIMHFAALIQVGDSVQNPADFYQNNVLGSLNLLEAARQHDIKHMVFSSTAAVYGIPNTEFISEDSSLSPINPYGQTKLAMEGMIRDYTEAYGLKHAILRYFNAAGADLDGEAGTAYPKDTHLIPLLMQVASNQRPEINIFGTDYNTTDGTAMRDYIHVTDLAQAHVEALMHILNNDNNITLNLGTNRGHSVRQVIDRSRYITQTEMRAIECNRREGDPAILVADARKAQKVLGWTPKHSDLDTIIASAWNWKLKQLGLDQDDIKAA